MRCARCASLQGYGSLGGRYQEGRSLNNVVFTADTIDLQIDNGIRFVRRSLLGSLSLP